jgi:hypothetical protein
MKRIIAIIIGVGMASGLAFAQGAGTGGGNGGTGANWNGENRQAGPVQNEWQKKVQHSYSESQASGDQTQNQNRVGKPVQTPPDVKAIVEKFKQDRTRLMSQLRTCSDEQRQQLLQQMEQLRTQLRDQLCQLREQAQQQAEQMRSRFGQNRDRMLNQGAGSSGTGRGR